MVERLAARGVLSKETHDTVIRFAPPLTITKALIDRAVDIFREVALDKRDGLAINSIASAEGAVAEAPIEAITQ
jgi:ornithine--oxo-acid transaminase